MLMNDKITADVLNHTEAVDMAKSPEDDLKLKYRKEVERRCNSGEFTIPARRLLNLLRIQLQLDPDIADAIEAEVQQLYREYQRKLKEYETTLIETRNAEPILTEITLRDLKDYQQHLGLRDEDVAAIETRIIGQQKPFISVEQSSEPIQPSSVKQFEFDIVIVNAEGNVTNRRRGQAEYFTEDLGNGVVLDMVAIPGGQFLMGSPGNEPERINAESPQHKVNVQPFFMGKFPITQAQWLAVAALNKVNIDLNADPFYFKGANRPVENVSWYDAVEFCLRLTAYTNREYRLPSEAEWEYACKAGTTTPFHFGETITSDLANYNANYTYTWGACVKGVYREETTEVGSFRVANAFGLYDMHGNAWEWCLDDWHKDYQGAPTDGSPWFDENDNFYQKQGGAVLRGGSWIVSPRLCRSAYRVYNNRDNHSNLNGFRVVCAAGRILR
ncbi:SUMF1/EgtB/PvdO family nonheme iron enzyme [Nostoc sp. NIES-2111]